MSNFATWQSLEADENNARKRWTDLAQELVSFADSVELKGTPTEGDLERARNLKRGVDRAESEYHAIRDRRAEAGKLAYVSGELDQNLTPTDDAGSGHELKGGVGALSPIAAEMKAANFDPQRNPSVVGSAERMLKSTFPSLTDLPRRQGGIVATGRDARWVYPLLPMENAGTDLVVQDFKQTARTLTGTVQRSATATTDKATLDVTLTSVVEAIPQHAVVIDEVPNAMLASFPQLSAFLKTEGLFQVQKSIDAHVYSQVTAASPAEFDEGDDLIARIRLGVSAMRDDGAEPSILVLDGATAAALDLSEDAGGYVFPVSNTGSTPWNLRVVERPGAAANPLLIDPAMLGVLYLGTVKFDADPFTGFKKNLTDLRIETSALYHVRNAKGALVLTEPEG